MKRVLLFCLVFLLALATPALAIDSGGPYSWANYGDPSMSPFVELFDGEGNSVQSWDYVEWQDQAAQVNADGTCMGMANCFSNEINGYTDLEGPTTSEANGAESFVQDARAEGTAMDLGEVQQAETMGAEAGAIPNDALTATNLVKAGISNGLDACSGGPLLCYGGAFIVGLAIGNGLDQLFGLPDLEELFEDEAPPKSEEELAAQAEKEGFTVQHVETGATYQKVTRTYTHPVFTEVEELEVEKKETKYLPPGYYIGPFAVANPPAYQKKDECGELKEHEISGGHSVPYCLATYAGLSHGSPPKGFSEEERIYEVESISCAEKVEFGTGCYHEGYNFHLEHPAGTFNKIARMWRATSLTEPAKECMLGPGTGCLKPLGIPAPNLITPGIEANNVKAGLPAHPVYPNPVTPPKSPPEKIKELETQKILEHHTIREKIKEHSTPAKTKEEVEAAPLTVPIPQPNELATIYATEVETAGFTSPKPEVYVLSEASSNPSEGPSDVGFVTPSPGSREKTGTKVTIGENPPDVGPPSGGVVGPPTEPGWKLPKFGVLCQGFPFGVPCWLVKTLEGWSTTAKAPELGIEEFTAKVGGHEKQIPTAKFDFAKLEPIMEKVRPVMVAFATIGIVLLFFRFAKGGSPDSSSKGGEADTNQGGGDGS